MLGKPNAGWADLKIGNFTACVSYLTNVPCDLIKAFSDFIQNGVGVASFDCEPYQFDVIFSYTMSGGVLGLVYVVDSDKKLVCENINVIDLAKEFVEDIKRDIDAWATWFGYEDDFAKIDMEFKKKIQTGIESLDKLIVNYAKHAR